MKNLKHILLSTGVAAGLLAGNTAIGADDPPVKQPSPADPKPAAQPPADAPGPDEQAVPQPAAQTPPPAATNVPAATTPAANTNSTSSVDDKGLIRFNFRNTRLDQILDFMSHAAGYIVNPGRNDLSTKVSVWSDQPVTKDEALTLLKQVFAQNGYQLIPSEPDDRTLTIITSLEAKHSNIPVVLFKGSPSDVPKTPDIFTYIIPVRSLNAVALIRDLQQLLPADTTVTANESGNSLVMTASQMNVRRVVEIVKALDSVSSSSSTITVFPLKFADAKTIASLIKDLFPSADSTRNGTGSGFNPFPAMRMFGGGGRGSGSDTGADTGNGHTPTTRISAVADDRSNSVAVSSPDEMVPTITELINQLDTNVQDLTEMRAFKLINADPTEMADQLAKLFPDPTKTDDNSTAFGGRRFNFFGPGGAMGNQNASGGSSDRSKKVNTVTAVPDPRTGTLTVTAGKDLMPQIASWIEALDRDPSGKSHAYVFDLHNADPQSVLQVLQDAFPPANGKTSTAATSASSSALQTRNTSMQNTQNQNTSQAFGSSGSGGRSGLP